jgi:transcriptional regulator with XRE-family HTH domain
LVGRIALDNVQIRFGLRLRQVRKRRGVSQEKLGDMAGLHRTYVSSIERGERNVSLVNIERLAMALGVDMAELMPETSERSSGR